MELGLYRPQHCWDQLEYTEESWRLAATQAEVKNCVNLVLGEKWIL